LHNVPKYLERKTKQ